MSTPTPETDAEETQQRAEYESLREVDWPSFPADFDFARKLERERDDLLAILGARKHDIESLRAENYLVKSDYVALRSDMLSWKAKAERTCGISEIPDGKGLFYLITNCGGHVNGRSDWCPHCGGRIAKEEK